MDQIEEFVDRRQKSLCIHCGAAINRNESTADHVPSKSPLRKPYPPNLAIVEICQACNNGLSLDEEYVFLFLQCILAGSASPDSHSDPKVIRALQRHGELRARIEMSRQEHVDDGGELRFLWKPEIGRVHRVILKNARGHAMFEHGEPMLAEPAHVWCAPVATMTEAELAEFESSQVEGLWPEVGSRMMTRMMTGQDLQNGWVMVQDGVYRYSVAQQGVMLVRSVLFEYLATEVRLG